MIDTFLKSTNKSSLTELKDFAVNVIKPEKGRAATEETESEAGKPAVGDPEYWYACVRFPVPLSPYGDIESCGPEEGAAVCGVWA